MHLRSMELLGMVSLDLILLCRESFMISLQEKEKYLLISLICRVLKTERINKPNQTKTNTQIQRLRVVDTRWGGGGSGESEMGKGGQLYMTNGN